MIKHQTHFVEDEMTSEQRIFTRQMLINQYGT